MQNKKCTLILYKNDDSSGEILIRHSNPKHEEIERKLIRSLSNKKRKFQYEIVTNIVEIEEDEEKIEVIFK